jgi:hypothetical protein
MVSTIRVGDKVTVLSMGLIAPVRGFLTQGKIVYRVISSPIGLLERHLFIVWSRRSL